MFLLSSEWLTAREMPLYGGWLGPAVSPLLWTIRKISFMLCHYSSRSEMKGEKHGAIWVAWYWGFTTLPPSPGQMYIGSCWDESIQCTIEAHMAECSPKVLSWVLPQHSGIQFSRASVVFYCPHKWQWLIIYSNWLILQWLWEAGSTLVHLIFTYPSTEWDGRDLENQHIEFCTGKSLQFALSMLAASLDPRMFFYPMA